MSDKIQDIDKHYSIGRIMDSIIQGLKAKGKDINNLKPEDLTPVDEFHTRGRISTMELAELFEFKPGLKVLDVGCGIGGSARYIARTFSCHVVGTDLIQEYMDAASQLAELVGMSEHVSFKQGNALELPFDSGSFDLVVTEHVQMNLKDKNKFYNEIARVLNSKGSMLFHDVFQGAGNGKPYYPVPWDEDGTISSLLTQEEAKEIIANAGFEVKKWIDKTRDSSDSFKTAAARVQKSGHPPLGLHILMGDTAKDKVVNMSKNLEEQKLSIVQGLAEKKSQPDSKLNFPG
ncbi:SAM-dependent methyltransferase [Desulfonema limicola]|uniref:SAM-dependent methyltransferase n=1 Tax=Desulfonema limicola TaxID=45656 RepID=A0A975GJP4_9BACT|nr:methyltransferase domain-containing protein [Desulfonema limicola]QTA83774.1 SAM-dependent methyltransferase [Desulfonema limicola]